LAARYVDPENAKGNLEPGQALFHPEPLEVIAGRSYTYEAELARIRAHNFAHAYAPPAYRSAPFRTRSLRRT
jgi:hypothetical protein